LVQVKIEVQNQNEKRTSESISTEEIKQSRITVTEANHPKPLCLTEK